MGVEFVLSRVCQGPSLLGAEMSRNRTRQFMTRQFTDMVFEDSSPTHMFYAKLTYGRKYKCQL